MAERAGRLGRPTKQIQPGAWLSATGRLSYLYSPAYDFVATIPYLHDEEAGLKFSRTRRFDEFSEDELAHLAARAMLPEQLVLDTARETVALFHECWQAEKVNLPLDANVIKAVETHLKTVPMA